MIVQKTKHKQCSVITTLHKNTFMNQFFFNHVGWHSTKIVFFSFVSHNCKSLQRFFCIIEQLLESFTLVIVGLRHFFFFLLRFELKVFFFFFYTSFSFGFWIGQTPGFSDSLLSNTEVCSASCSVDFFFF